LENTVTTDVVIIGSGVSGALLAHRLAKQGIKVLILEAGKSVERAQAVNTFENALIKVPESAYTQAPQAMFPRTDEPHQWYVQAGPDIFKSTYLKVMGGTTWHWLGTAIRLIPSDFNTQTLFGQGIDWPINYSDLEPYYIEAENELGVSGHSMHDQGSPRQSPYPLPAIAQSYCDQTFIKELAQTPYEVTPTPQARNSVAHDNRPACCGSSSCIPVCPIQAKYDATVHIKKAQAAGAALMTESTAVQLLVGKDQKIEAVKYKRWDQSEGFIKAKQFILACHAIEIPRLLLASKTSTYPQGLSNRSDQVGRNLMDHPVQLSWALSQAPVYPYRGPQSTSGIENMRDGGFRRNRAAFRIEIGNDGWGWPTGAPTSTAQQFARAGLRGKVLDQAIANQASRHIRLASLMEQLPDPENRVSLDLKELDIYGVPRPKLHYRVDDYVQKGLNAAQTAHTEIFGHIRATDIQHKQQYEGAGHIIGTTRMGHNEKSSVVDANLVSHDHTNLMIVGSSVFPTGGTANPTLTIAALSLRASDFLIRQLRLETNLKRAQ
jgi:choline dehydrogenase-like flavoprotein